MIPHDFFQIALLLHYPPPFFYIYFSFLSPYLESPIFPYLPLKIMCTQLSPLCFSYPHPPPPQAVVPFYFPSSCSYSRLYILESEDLELRTSHEKKKQAMFVFLSLSYDHFKLHPFNFKVGAFIFLCAWTVLHSVYVSHFPYLSSAEGHIGCFYFLAIVNRAAANMAGQVSICRRSCWVL